MSDKLKRTRKHNLRAQYELSFGKIEDGKELHHVVPWYAGGTDEWYNIIALTPEEHQRAHMDRWEKFGDFRDLCAYYMIGYNFTEAHRISSSVGGKLDGAMAMENCAGIHTKDSNVRKQWASAGGKAGGKIQKEKKLGIHGASKEQNIIWSSMGGLASGAFTNSELQRELGKRGGPKNKGFVWLNDGMKLIKYTVKLQQVKSVEQFLMENPKIKRGCKLNAKD